MNSSNVLLAFFALLVTIQAAVVFTNCSRARKLGSPEASHSCTGLRVHPRHFNGGCPTHDQSASDPSDQTVMSNEHPQSYMGEDFLAQMMYETGKGKS